MRRSRADDSGDDEEEAAELDTHYIRAFTGHCNVRVRVAVVLYCRVRVIVCYASSPEFLESEGTSTQRTCGEVSYVDCVWLDNIKSCWK